MSKSEDSIKISTETETFTFSPEFEIINMKCKLNKKTNFFRITKKIDSCVNKLSNNSNEHNSLNYNNTNESSYISYEDISFLDLNE